ncbi:MAG: hypothetical protein AAFV54_10375, partial [Pseudomonadota bacterium]
MQDVRQSTRGLSKKILLAAGLALTSPAFAHQDHDHAAPALELKLPQAVIAEQDIGKTQREGPQSTTIDDAQSLTIYQGLSSERTNARALGKAIENERFPALRAKPEIYRLPGG